MKAYLRLAGLLSAALLMTCPPLAAQEELSFPGVPAFSAEKKQSPPANPPATARKARLKEIVVSPTGKIEDEGAKKLPAVVETLTPEGIERINTVETADVFKYLPGSYLRKLYSGSTNSPLVIRGNSSNQTARTLVSVDGMAISDLTASGHSNAPKWHMVLPGEIENVEVIYGPYSAAHGGNSMSGAALITTHMPEKREAQADCTYFYQNFREYNTKLKLNGLNANAMAGDKIGPLAFAIWANHLESEAQTTTYTTKTAASVATLTGSETTVSGWDSDTDPSGNPRYILGGQGLTRYRNNTVKTKIAYDFGEYSRLRFDLALFDSRGTRDDPESYLVDAAGNSVYAGAVNIDGKRYSLSNSTFAYSASEISTLLYGLSYSHNVPGKMNITATLSTFVTDKDITRTSSSAPPLAEDGGSGVITDKDTGWKTSDLKGSYIINARGVHTLGAGYHLDRYSVDSETWSTPDWKTDERTALTEGSRGVTQTQGVFLDDAWDINQQWSVYLGGRYEWWQGKHAAKSLDVAGTGRLTAEQPDKRDSNLSPKFSMSFKPADAWRVRLSLAKATRYPAVGELYNAGVNAAGITNTANPDLKPERVLAHDLTITHTLGASGEARLTFFQDDITDAIYSQTNSYTNVTNYQNVDEVSTKGIELAVNQRKTFIDGLGVFANVAWTDAETVSNVNVPESVGKNFPRVPVWRAKCVLDYSPDNRFFVNLAGHYSGRQYNTLDNSDREGGYGGVDDFLIYDTKVSYQVLNALTAWLGVDNITNRLVHVSHPYPCRTFNIGLKYQY